MRTFTLIISCLLNLFIVTLIADYSLAQSSFRQNAPDLSAPPPPQVQSLGWAQVPTPATSALLYVTSTGSDTIWAGASLLRSTDRGLTWEQPSAPIPAGAIRFFDSSHGWLILGDTAYETIDGGGHWQASQTGMNDIHAIATPSKDTVFTSYLHQISRSTNGGKTWSATMLNAVTINAISFSDAKHGYAVGNKQTVLPDSPLVGVVFRTSDAGEHWEMLYSGLKYDLFGVAALGGSIAVVTSDYGYIARTTNSGGTWKDSLATPLGNGFASVTFHDNEGIAIGALGKILLTVDSGRSWSEEVSGTSKILYAAAFIDDTTIVVVGDKGIVLRTTTKGLSAVQPQAPIAQLMVQTFPNPSTASTQFAFTLPEPQHVSLVIYSITGNFVQQVLSNRLLSKGSNRAAFNGSNLAAGSYNYLLTSEKYRSSGQLQLIK